MVLAASHVRRLAHYAEPDRPISMAAVHALRQEAEARVQTLTEKASEHADRKGRKTIFPEDVALAARPPKKDEVWVYVEALESALHVAIEEARTRGVVLDAPKLPPAPIREA